MRLPLLLSVSLLLCSLLSVRAQLAPADDFFHGGALRYLSNNIPAAIQTVTNGLQLYPDDEKLKKLYDLLNQQQQQQQQQQDQQDQKQDQKDEQKKDEKKDQQSKNDQQKKGDEKKQQDAKDKKEQERKDQQQSKPGDKSKERPEDKKETGQPQQVAAHAMTPQEAKQLLDAQKGDEQVLIFKPETDPKRQNKKLKDW
jgi:Ca-activated chloride channel family protein